MAIKNEITILTRAEQANLYSPPIFSIEEGVWGAMEPKTNVRKISVHFIE